MRKKSIIIVTSDIYATFVLTRYANSGFISMKEVSKYFCFFSLFKNAYTFIHKTTAPTFKVL